MAAGSDPRRPRPGVEEWRNPGNGFFVTQIHYSADPVKRPRAWADGMRRNYPPRSWLREYEMSWTAPEGEPVIAEFEGERHVRVFPMDKGLRLLRFWDFGFDSPVVLFAQLSLEGQLRVRRELCPFNTPIQALVDSANALSLELMGNQWMLAGKPGLDVGGQDALDALFGKKPTVPAAWDAGDPAGKARTDLGSTVDYLAALGIHMHTSRPGTEASYEGLRQRFLKNVVVKGTPDPAILIHPECVALRAALAGAFHRSPLPPYKPVKCHPHKDLVDALRYGNDNLASASTWSEGAMHAAAIADRDDTVGRIVGEPVRRDTTWAKEDIAW